MNRTLATLAIALVAFAPLAARADRDDRAHMQSNRGHHYGWYKKRDRDDRYAYNKHAHRANARPAGHWQNGVWVPTRPR